MPVLKGCNYLGIDFRTETLQDGGVHNVALIVDRDLDHLVAFADARQIPRPDDGIVAGRP